MEKPGILLGALVGLLLIAPLIVIMGLANQLLGLPFLPFDLFPFIRDAAPGGLLTFTIDTMVDTIIALDIGRVDTIAKPVEQGMAVMMVVAIGVVFAAILFAVMRGMKSRPSYLPGLLMGLILGVLMAILSINAVPQSARIDSPLINGLWTVLLFTVWALGVNWAYLRLLEPSSVPQTKPAR